LIVLGINNFGNATLSNLFSRVNEAIKTPRVIIFLHSLRKKVRKKALHLTQS
jgi:hypothetical protein